MTASNDAYISTKGLTLTTPMGVVYKNVNLTAQKGDVVAIFGSEGSGKTAFLITMAGRMRFKGGQASIAGFDLKKQYKKVRRMSNITLVHRLNDVPENARVRDILSAELQVVGKSGRKAAVEAYLREWDLLEVENTKFKDLESYVSKRFDIALACCGEPKILMVDDIQTGLTQHQSLRVIDWLHELCAKKDMTVLVGTVEYDIARMCDKVVVFSESAERQHQACLADNGPAVECVVCGTANGVQVEKTVEAMPAPKAAAAAASVSAPKPAAAPKPAPTPASAPAPKPEASASPAVPPTPQSVVDWAQPKPQGASQDQKGGN